MRPFSCYNIVMAAITSTVDIVYDYGLTTIEGVVTNFAGTPIAYARVFWYPKAGGAMKIEADENGYWCVVLAEGLQGSLVIKELLYDEKITVPAIPHDTIVFYKDITPDAVLGWPVIKFHV